MAGKGGGLFAVVGPPPAEDDAEDYSDDALPADDDEPLPEPGGGPFETYCETVFDDKADYQSRCDALREAIMTLLEERGG